VVARTLRGQELRVGVDDVKGREAAQHIVHEDMVEVLRHALEDVGIALLGRQRQREVREPCLGAQRERRGLAPVVEVPEHGDARLRIRLREAAHEIREHARLGEALCVAGRGGDW